MVANVSNIFYFCIKISIKMRRIPQLMRFLPLVVALHSHNLGGLLLHSATYITRRCAVYGQMDTYRDVCRNV